MGPRAWRGAADPAPGAYAARCVFPGANGPHLMDGMIPVITVAEDPPPITQGVPAMFAMNTVRSAVLVATVAAGAVVAAIGGGIVGGDQFPEVFASQSSQSAQALTGACAIEEPEIGAEEFSRTELYFGSARPDGTAVTAAEWTEFLAEEITPRFPAGLTVISGMGQWQEEDSDIVQERSQLVILFYPREFAVESGAAIEEIRAAYEAAFQQESVLRADDDAAPVCVSF